MVDTRRGEIGYQPTSFKFGEDSLPCSSWETHRQHVHVCGRVLIPPGEYYNGR